MKNLIYKITLVALLIFTSTNLFAQEDKVKKVQQVTITMNNGDEFSGEIIKKDDKIITLKTVNGEINLIAANVKSIENNDYDGKFSFANPHDTRYFFGPSGIPIKKGKGYYQNVMVTTNFVNVGLTNNVSIGGGFEFISTVTGNPVWFLTPKLGFEVAKNVHVGGGVIVAGIAADDIISLGYGVVTLGNTETNLTVGGGYGFGNGEISTFPTIMISGTHRVSNGLALLSENYIIPIDGNTTYLGIHGLRLLSKKNAFDIGAIVIPEIFDFIPALPYVGYARAF